MAFFADRFTIKLLLLGLVLVAASVAGSVLLTSALIAELNAADQAEAYMAAITVPLIVSPIALSIMASLVLRNHRLLIEVDRLANHDDLTGLMNRRSFMRCASERLAGPAKAGRAVLAVADLDHFKRVNDSHGYAAGDIALRHVAMQLLQSAPDGSLVARLGGEEFAILFEWTDVHEVQQVMRRVCETLRAARALWVTGRDRLLSQSASGLRWRARKRTSTRCYAVPTPRCMRPNIAAGTKRNWRLKY